MSTSDKMRYRYFIPYRFKVYGREKELVLAKHNEEPYITLESLALLTHVKDSVITKFIEEEGYQTVHKKATSGCARQSKPMIHIDAALLFLFEGPISTNGPKALPAAQANALYAALTEPVNFRNIYYKLDLKPPVREFLKPKTTAGDYFCLGSACFKPIAKARFED